MLKYILLLLIVKILSFSSSGAAVPLNFLAEKNGVKVLPQKFEYDVIDGDHIQIGDVLVDFKSLNIEILKNSKDHTYRFQFSWPGRLLTHGKISVRDSLRKTLWSEALDEKRLQFKETSHNENLIKKQVAIYTSAPIDEGLLQELRSQSFLNFCVFREDGNDKIYLCSKELFLLGQHQEYLFKSRQKEEAESEVEVNGHVVSSQGVILLNSDRDVVSLRARTPLGATLEIDTKQNNIEFMDAVNNGSSVRLTARGADPMDEKSVKRLANGDWQVDLPHDRPFLYLKGHGGVALRQDFIIDGPLPFERQRPSLKGRHFSQTYEDHVEVEIQVPQGLEVQQVEKSDHIEALANQNKRWVLGGLEKGESNRHFLMLQQKNASFYTFLDVKRGTRHDLRLGLLNKMRLKNSVEGEIPNEGFSPFLSIEGSLGWWFEDFFSIPSTRFRWGSYLKTQTAFIKRTGEGPKTDYSADLRFRLRPGLFRQDSSGGLLANLYHLQLNSKSYDLGGVGGFWTAPSSWLPGFDLYEIEGFYAVAGLGSGRPTTSFKIQGDLFIKHKTRLLSYYGLELERWKIIDDVTLESELWRLRMGLNWCF